MQSFILAIMREEGWYRTPPARNRRNNNPGNLEYGKFTIAHGATHGDPRFAVFSEPSAGFAALYSLLKKDYVGLTVSAAIHKFAPASENDTESYIKNVCEFSGLTPDTVLTVNNIA